MSTATARSANARTLIEMVNSLDREVDAIRQLALTGQSTTTIHRALLQLASPISGLTNALYEVDESSRFEDGTLSEWNTDFREVEEEIIEEIRSDLKVTPYHRDWRPDGNAPDGGCEFNTGRVTLRVGRSIIPFRGRVEIDGIEIVYERLSIEGETATYQLSFA